MQVFHFPTTILFGPGAVTAWLDEMRRAGRKRPLVVTDPGLMPTGIVSRIEAALRGIGCRPEVFAEVHPNPIEEDVEKGVAAYRAQGADCLVALGGGSAMDAAKVIRLMAAHEGPLAQYEESRGGTAFIRHPMPPLSAIPTTAGTGSEAGRAGVITLKGEGRKAIFFHPRLIPDFAVLEPELTAGLPPALTAATGIDAFTHCLEAYLAPVYHPMADGIALEGLRLILANLPRAHARGGDLEARGNMQMAAAMGAVAFQKGLGMVHALAHPLSARYNTHHGLSNALLLPASLAFLERAPLPPEARVKLERAGGLFREAGLEKGPLSQSCRVFFASLGIVFGLGRHGIAEKDLEALSAAAFDDPSHATNAVPVTREDLLAVYRAAY